uniref:Serine protease sat autotransporter, Serine protease sat translocator]) n=1 Tax=Ganoderma boninense TaxID=34458 RepID=A0A5K1JU27_9APHY|nr:Serine protease sat autotransporter (EC [Cleaved into: Serine protease sat (Secreted autotransporter toxin sat), Serine protease sat translocator] [Ganoderma boninense]
MARSSLLSRKRVDESVVAPLNLTSPPPPRGMPDLDEDVMEAICGSINNIHDLLSVSLTCSMMWRIAIRQLLRTQTIHLKSHKAISGFREFILNQKPTRAQHIRSLAIPLNAWSDSDSFVHRNDIGDQLMDILDCAVNLDTLDLSLNDFYRAARERVSSAFAGMATLRHLSVSDPYMLWAHTALNALRSPPATICVRSTNGEASLLKLATSLDRFHATSSVLTSLHFDLMCLDDSDVFGLPQIRSVRSVFITKFLSGPRLVALLHLFPNLDGSLCFRLALLEVWTLLENDRQLAQIREDNRRAQEVSCWARLDRLDCEASTAFAFALQCPVRHLTIDRFELRVLAEMRPQHLVITSIRVPQDLALIKDPMHTSVLAGGSQPTHVVLVLEHEAQDERAANADFVPRRSENIVFKSAVQALAFFPHVMHAHLAFHCYKDHAFRDELDEYDFVHQMRECASITPDPQILAAFPSLRGLVVTAAGRDESQSGTGSGESWLGTRAWQVIACEDRQRTVAREESVARRFEELSDRAMKGVIETEDLRLPDEWELYVAMKQLDVDVMETICSSIDNAHDLLSLSLTSPCVWHMAIRATLRNHTIRLASRKAIRSFRGFIINVKSTYAHHVRSLAIPNAAWMSIHEDHRPDEDNQLAMEILGCAVDLESLDFSLDPSYSAIPRVSSAFSSLEALRRLSVFEPLVTGDRSWVPHALHALRAPLVALCITTSKYQSAPNGLANYWDQNLSRFATSTTLTSLHLARIPVYDSSFLRLPRFASVRSLTVAEPLLREQRLDAFLHLFPSLDGTLRLRVEYWNAFGISSNPQELATV